MPALNFQKQFVTNVEDGDKTHSIRGYRKQPFKVGDKLALYYGQRTRHCRLLFRTTVTKVQDIHIAELLPHAVDWDGTTFEHVIRLRLSLSLDGELLAEDEAEAMAKRDGFDSLHAMGVWWLNVHDLPFHGQIIHWQYPPKQQRKEACQTKSPQSSDIGASRSTGDANGAVSEATYSSSTRNSARRGRTAGSASAKTTTAASVATVVPATSAPPATRLSVHSAAARAKTAQ